MGHRTNFVFNEQIKATALVLSWVYGTPFGKRGLEIQNNNNLFQRNSKMYEQILYYNVFSKVFRNFEYNPP
jgi:hypothetical protein